MLHFVIFSPCCRYFEFFFCLCLPNDALALERLNLALEPLAEETLAFKLWESEFDTSVVPEGSLSYK